MHNYKKKRIITLIVSLVAALICGILYWFQWMNVKNRKESDLFFEDTVTAMQQETLRSQIPIEEESSREETFVTKAVENRIYVYVCGQVCYPGVYELDEGARVYEAIECAGGVTENGVLDMLPMACRLVDEQRIYVPAQGEEVLLVTGAVESDVSEGKVDLNHATKEQLMTLPGIGESRAEAILQYRSEHGKFTAIEEIQNISGIKSAAFSKIRDYIVVR